MLQLSIDGKTVAIPFNMSILNWAAGTREILNSVQLPKGISFYNIYGTSFDTPFDVWYVTELNQIFSFYSLRECCWSGIFFHLHELVQLVLFAFKPYELCIKLTFI